jgi:hypothetical protein
MNEIDKPTKTENPPSAGEPKQESLGLLPYVIAGLSYFPGPGILFGVAAMVWGVVTGKQGGRRLIALGAGGIALSILLYGIMFAFIFANREGPFQSVATIIQLCPSGAPRPHLVLRKSTNDWEMGHVTLHNASDFYLFSLPAMPDGRKSFSLAESPLVKTQIHTKGISLPLSGTIVVDPIQREIIVSMKTADGVFSGNGSYPLAPTQPFAIALFYDAVLASCDKAESSNERE